MRLFILSQIFITVAGRRVRYGVKGRGVKGYHTNQRQHKNESGAWHGIDYVHDKPVQIAARLVLGDEVCRSLCLKTEAVVAEDYKADNSRAHAENVTAEYSLLYRPAAAYVADKEGRRYAPYHPVSPVIYGPILREAVRPYRIGIGGQLEEILEHFAQRLEAVFNDKSPLPANDKNQNEQAEEKIYAELGEEAYAFKAVHNRVCVHGAGYEQNNYCYSRAADAQAEKL